MTSTQEKLRVVAISGSLRKESMNRKALQIAKRFASQAGVIVEEMDLKELDIPVFDQDIMDQGMPESVQRLKLAVKEAEVIIIASPEYNYSVPGGLKNAIDWLSRGENSLEGKVAAIFGVSNGINGTIRMQPQLKIILNSLNVSLVPQPQVMIRNGREAFTPEGGLVDSKLEAQLKMLIEKTLHLAKAMKEQ